MAGLEPAQPREGKKTNNVGSELAWPSNITDGKGELFSLPSSCMQNAIHSACRRKKNSKTQTMKGKKSYRSGCFAGGATV